MITERKLRQIVKQELLNLLEGRVPMEDLAIFYKLLQHLQYFPLPNEKERQTISILDKTALQLQFIIKKIEKEDINKRLKQLKQKSKLDEGIRDTLKYYFGKEEKPTPEVFTKSDLTVAIDEVKEKLNKLEDVIKDKRYLVGSSKYLQYHNHDIKPLIDELIPELKEATQSNVSYPPSEAELELPKRTTLKHQKLGRQ